MVINSIPFLLFFLAVFILYYTRLKKGTALWQNIILLVASYFFYGYADIKTLPLFVIVTIVFYVLGIFIQKHLGTKKAEVLLVFGIILGAGLLIVFKYLDFLIDSMTSLLSSLGLQVNAFSLKLIMPLGISYFVFKLISYLITIHREEIPATRNFIEFATYVAFFPCMLSGPIDRPGVFIPQLKKERIFSYPLSIDGLRQILWGLFKKMAIADSLACYVDLHLSANTIQQNSGSTMIFVIIAYTFQIYADFSGYSDMAIGVGKLLGIRVAKNFNYPFFALNIADFWRRWHISLTSWMTDYIYIPLSFSFRSIKKLGLLLAILVNFLVVGIWHGANWNYLIYGFYHGMMFIPLIFGCAMMTSRQPAIGKYGLPVLKDFARMLGTFVIVSFGMIIFRSTDFTTFTSIVFCLSRNFVSLPDIGAKTPWILVMFLVLFEWIQRYREYALDLSGIKSGVLRWGIYCVLILVIFLLGGGEQHFIYQVF